VFGLEKKKQKTMRLGMELLIHEKEVSELNQVFYVQGLILLEVVSLVSA